MILTTAGQTGTDFASFLGKNGEHVPIWPIGFKAVSFITNITTDCFVLKKPHRKNWYDFIQGQIMVMFEISKPKIFSTCIV